MYIPNLIKPLSTECQVSGLGITFSPFFFFLPQEDVCKEDLGPNPSWPSAGPVRPYCQCRCCKSTIKHFHYRKALPLLLAQRRTQGPEK